MINSIFASLLLVCLFTGVLASVPNRSNVPTQIAVPILAALLTKFVVGDWDAGYAWTLLDVVYWPSLLGTSYATLLLLLKRD